MVSISILFYRSQNVSQKYANFDRIQTLKFRFGSDQGEIQLPDIKTCVCVF